MVDRGRPRLLDDKLDAMTNPALAPAGTSVLFETLSGNRSKLPLLPLPWEPMAGRAYWSRLLASFQ